MGSWRAREAPETHDKRVVGGRHDDCRHWLDRPLLSRRLKILND